MIDLDKILELEAKASGAPWDEMHFDTYCCAVGPECYEQKQARKDQDLINLMRNNIRQICLELKAAREVIATVRHQTCYAGNDCMGVFLAVDNAIDKYDEVTNGKG